MIRGFEYVSDHLNKTNAKVNGISLPIRSTAKSAGYDFYSPTDVLLLPDEVAIVWTDVKVKIPDDECLKIYTRSSLATKKKITLANSVAVIDSDYYENPTNDGNIGIALWNFGRYPQSIEKGDKIAQGIFEKFLIADTDDASGNRSSGFGSTGL